MRDQPTNSDKLNIQLEWMLIPLFCSLTGYTVKAVQRKIEEGKWIEGRHYRRAPDGHVTMNLQAYYRWVSEPGAGAGG
jgi:hypothetical protein